MINIEEIPVENMEEFWKIHIRYLVDDQIITDPEDIEYFQSEEYRGIIKTHMLRDRDRHHMIYFVRDGIRIGAAQYCTYQSEDGKCFILDYWMFPEYRGQGAGHECFEALEAYTKADDAVYYEINAETERRVHFWNSLGFVENGVDEDGIQLFIKKESAED